jgi:hypothetical protein
MDELEDLAEERKPDHHRSRSVISIVTESSAPTSMREDSMMSFESSVTVDRADRTIPRARSSRECYRVDGADAIKAMNARACATYNG